MTNFAPNLSTGPCLYCGCMAESGPDEMLRCDLCRQTAHICCLKSGLPQGRLVGDNFFCFTCSFCHQNDTDSTVRAKLNIPQLLLLVLYNLHMTKTESAWKGFFHWKIHIYSFIHDHWKEIFGPDRFKKKKKTLQASLSGQLSHYGQYFVSGFDTIKDGGWYKLSMILPPAQLIQQYTAEKNKSLPSTSVIKEDNDSVMEVTIHEDIVDDGPSSSRDESSESNCQDETSQGSWYMEKDILRPHSLPPVSLFDSEEEFAEDVHYLPKGNNAPKGEVAEASKEIDIELVDVDNGCVREVKANSTTQAINLKKSLFTKSNVVHGSDQKKLSNWATAGNIRALSTYEEQKLLRELKRLQKAGPLLPHLHRLHRKLSVRLAKYQHAVPLFDFDTEVKFFETYGRLQSRAERIKSKVSCESSSDVRVLDRFQISTKGRHRFEDKSVSFLTKLVGSTDETISLIYSPYTLRNLKPYILRDYESLPLKLGLLQEIIQHHHRNDKSWSPPPRFPIDYCYVTPKHIPAMNQMARHFFWPGIDLSEVLQYPDHTCVVLYRHLVVGFGILVPDTDYNTAYISFLIVHPEWRRAGIATFILYHLIQTSMGKDITLHVSAANPALIMYQKFGFKVEEFLSDFYDKYLPDDSHECKHAMFLRLSR
ncbi:Cysteine-rich protein 2-binding protein [Halocaridina rubra]|uniref:Cysteine-rich protein 2-binding protein n=1 Tax=Halocaridina rubra TaxID=373956 RepID=A0AAN8WW84_HALRR